MATPETTPPDRKIPRQSLTLSDISRFLAEQNLRTRHEKMPVPMLNQVLLDKPSFRHRYGHVFVGMFFELSGELQRERDLYGREVDAMALGRQVFARLGEGDIREGPEGIISSEQKGEIRAAAEGIDTPAIRTGRRVLELLQGNPFRGVASEALLAVELDATIAHDSSRAA